MEEEEAGGGGGGLHWGLMEREGVGNSGLGAPGRWGVGAIVAGGSTVGGVVILSSALHTISTSVQNSLSWNRA